MQTNDAKTIQQVCLQMQTHHYSLNFGSIHMQMHSVNPIFVRSCICTRHQFRYENASVFAGFFAKATSSHRWSYGGLNVVLSCYCTRSCDLNSHANAFSEPKFRVFVHMHSLSVLIWKCMCLCWFLHKCDSLSPLVVGGACLEWSLYKCLQVQTQVANCLSTNV